MDSSVQQVNSFLQLTQGQRLGDYLSVSSISSEGAALPLSLTVQTDWVLDFLFQTGATAAGLGCLSGSAAGCVATVPVDLFSFPSPERCCIIRSSDSRQWPGPSTLQ